MKATITRRGFAGSVSAAVVLPALGFGVPVAASAAAARTLSAEPLTEGVLWIRGADANLLQFLVESFKSLWPRFAPDA